MKFIILLLTITSLLFSDNPQRIVSLGPLVTKNLYMLGLTDKVVGITEYCPEAESKTITKVGSVVKSSIETIVALTPDLVLATGLTEPSLIEKLEGIGIKTIRIYTAKSYEEMKSNLKQIGELTGTLSNAEKIVNDTDLALQNIIENSSDKVKVFFQIGTSPVFTISDNNFINDMINFAGGVNVALDSGVGIYSREKVIEKNPDVIVITTMGGLGEEEKNQWNIISTMKAVESKSVYIVDQDLFCSPTLKQYPEAVRQLKQLIHK
ncbi:MAG: ABC transporter substrate-binding protein [Candidatus Delongbacteria bacterium]|nr:ABC transporter substrate-binding protein [Candidatus Delongbacteria bacterium]MBN2836051.1 ABC transporter substrate-binding protein [Candidatus Delongbacteria bacterium]